MRLRSSQFVFLLLIACSVQIQEEHALGWMQQTVAGSSTRNAIPRDAMASAAPSAFHSAKPVVRRALCDLPPATLALRRKPWTMTPPAMDSAAVLVHTGLLRV